MKVCPMCGAEYGDDAAFCARDRTPLASPAGTGLIGQVIGERYRVIRRLGGGGMGDVYLAEHVLMGRPSAVKVISPNLTQDPDAAGRFHREATNASKISHPNVAAIYDFGLTPDGLVYLAMEFVDGRTLREELSRTGPLPATRVATIVRQCAHGLQAAHDLGIVHRDLKPDNIMLAGPAGGVDAVKLVDFGVAKAMGHAARGGQEVTRAGMVVGTPEYMAPEQLAGDPMDGRGDLYALGLVTYRMLTDALPFSAETAQETMVKRLTDPPLPINQVSGRHFPDGIQRALDRALARRPQDRAATVGEFAEAFGTAVREADLATRGQVTAVLDGPAAGGGGRRLPRARRWSTARTAFATVGVATVIGGGWMVLRGLNGGVGSPPPAAPVAAPDTMGATNDTGGRGSTNPVEGTPGSTRTLTQSAGISVPLFSSRLALPDLDSLLDPMVYRTPEVYRAYWNHLAGVHAAPEAGDSLRAVAASYLSQMALEAKPANVTLACAWADSALALRNDSVYQRQAKAACQRPDSSGP